MSHRPLFAVSLLLFIGLLYPKTSPARPSWREPPAPIGAGKTRSAPPKPTLNFPQAEDPLEFLFTWERDLERQMPRVAPRVLAWTLLASPLWIPPLLWLLVYLIRRRRDEDDRKAKPLPRLSERPTPRTEPPKLSDAQTLLARPAPERSLYLVFLASGARADSVQAWRRIAKDELSPERWRALIAGEDDALLPQLSARWIKRLARERVLAWINAEPLIRDEALSVEIPNDLDVSAINEIVLVGRDGLAIEADALQEAILIRAQRGLKETYRGASNPFILEHSAQREELPALLGDLKDPLASSGTYALATLLCGIRALDGLAEVGLLSTRRGALLRERLQRHIKQERGPIPDEGCAAHAILELPGPEPKGIGALLASLAGAAYSPATVALEISRALPQKGGAAFERLGRLAIAILADEDDPRRKRIHHRLREILGEATLARALPAARSLAQTTSREVNHSPLWPQVKASPTPDLALATLHHARLEHALNQVDAAHARLTQILAKVAYAGRSRRDQHIAAQRLGYALASLIPGLFETFKGEISSAAQAAAAFLYALGAPRAREARAQTSSRGAEDR